MSSLRVGLTEKFDITKSPKRKVRRPNKESRGEAEATPIDSGKQLLRRNGFSKNSAYSCDPKGGKVAYILYSSPCVSSESREWFVKQSKYGP